MCFWRVGVCQCVGASLVCRCVDFVLVCWCSSSVKRCLPRCRRATITQGAVSHSWKDYRFGEFSDWVSVFHGGTGAITLTDAGDGTCTAVYTCFSSSKAVTALPFLFL